MYAFFFGPVAINTGNNLQSLGMQNLELELYEKATLAGELPPASKDIDPKLSTTWRVGTTVFVSGSLLNFASYSLAPQSLLASLEAIQFVTNVMFGKFVLGKPISGRMYLGTVLTVAGTILAILFSSKASVARPRCWGARATLAPCPGRAFVPAWCAAHHHHPNS